MTTTTASVTAPKTRRAAPVKAPARKTPARKVAAKALDSAFDREALLLEEEQALSAVLLEASDMPALEVAMRRLLEVRVRLHLQENLAHVFETFELRYDESNRGYAAGTLHLKFKFLPELAKTPSWLSESDLFKGLPKFLNYGSHYTQSLFKCDKVEGSFDVKLEADGDKALFVMFGLTVKQLVMAGQAWRSTRDALVAQAQTRLSQSKGAEAKTLAAVTDLEARRAQLVQELEELDEELGTARSKAAEVRQALTTKVNATKPPMLKHLNDVRALLSLKPLLG